MAKNTNKICINSVLSNKEHQELCDTISRLKKQNVALRRKNKKLHIALEVYEKFTSSLPFSVKDFNNV